MMWGFVYLYATLPFLVLSTPCPPILLLLPITSYLLPLTSFLFFSPLCSVSFYPVSIPHLLSCSSTPTSILPYLLSSLCSFSFYPVSIPHLLSCSSYSTYLHLFHLFSVQLLFLSCFYPPPPHLLSSNCPPLLYSAYLQLHFLTKITYLQVDICIMTTVYVA